MKPEQVRQITRGFTEQPKSEEPKSSAIDIFFDREYEKQNPKSESVHYKGRPVTELEANLIPTVSCSQPGCGNPNYDCHSGCEKFEVKSITNRESYDMIWSAGVREGADQKRAEIVAMVMNMTRENPNVSGLEILKKL